MKIHELLSGPEKWTRQAMGRNEKGGVCASNSPSAVKWCLKGAAEVCYGFDGGRYMSVVNRLGQEVGSVEAYNDRPSRTFEEVHALVKRLDV